MARRPLTNRPLDLLYFCFFLMHIPASVLVDFQALYPKSLVPAALQGIVPFYIELWGDPLMAGAFFNDTPYHAYAWFRSLVWIEFLFQFPVFVIGARGLWNDSPKVYLLLLIYGASTATTVIPCIATVLTIPTATDAVVGQSVTTAQRLMLLSSYVPFFLVPLVITLDMARRIAVRVDAKSKVM